MDFWCDVRYSTRMTGNTVLLPGKLSTVMGKPGARESDRPRCGFWFQYPLVSGSQESNKVLSVFCKTGKCFMGYLSD